MSNWIFKDKNPQLVNKANLKVILHADDFGLCDDITNEIFDCIGSKRIHRTSVICNTEGFTLAKKLYKEHTGMFDVSLHLNIVEGKPISDIKDVDLLINNIGEFRYTFLSLWLTYLFSKKSRKAKLKEQVKKEIEGQIGLFRTLWGDDKRKFIRIDGHTHVHMIPFVLDVILEIAKENRIGSIRSTHERFFICLNNLRNYFSLNIIKHFLLNFLSELQIDKIRRSGLSSNNYLIGILSTGNMNFNSVSRALRKLNGVEEQDGIVEILFHPGGFIDTHDKKDHFKFRQYYVSENRKREKQFLMEADIYKLLNDRI